MNRKLAREEAMKKIFQMDIQGDYSQEMIDKISEELPKGSQTEYIKEVLNHFIINKDEIDHMIEENTKEWKIDRISKVILAILRVAVIELCYMKDIPSSVSINEAVEIGKTYDSEEAGKFVNGILGSVFNHIEKK